MSLLDDLHAQLYAALRNDVVLTGMLGEPDALYDVVPERRQFPFVTISQVTSADWSTDEMRGLEALATVRVWSRTSNRGETYNLADRIVQLVTNADLATDAMRVVLATHVSGAYERDTSNRAFRGTLRFRFLVEPRLQ